MKNKRLPGKIASFALNVIEVYLPGFVFATLFVSFILQIIFRYFLVPLTWPDELALLCFIWVALLGALYAMRTDSHVKFTIIYDILKPKHQRIVRIAGNLLLLTAFLIALVPSWEFVDFMSFKKSNVLRIPMNIAYFPFVIFLVGIIGRIGFNIAVDIRSILKKENPEEQTQ